MTVVDSPDRKGAAVRRKISGPRPRQLAWPAAALVLAAEAVLLVRTPTHWRLALAFVLTVLMLLTVVVVTVRMAHRKAAASATYDAPPAAYLTAAHASQDPDAPSERIGLAYELARRRVPASWIAARCALPHAFVELIIAEVTDTPGTPRRRD
jgi:hypothetical protein